MSTDNLPATQAGSCVPGHNGRLYPVVGTPLTRCPCNFDVTTFKGKAMLLQAGEPGDIELRPGEELVIRAVHFLIYPEERIDEETGAVSTFARTVLFDKEGRHFRTTSAHVPHRITAALDLFGPEEWEKGIPFVICERPSKRHKGGTWHSIRVLQEQEF